MKRKNTKDRGRGKKAAPWLPDIAGGKGGRPAKTGSSGFNRGRKRSDKPQGGPGRTDPYAER